MLEELMDDEDELRDMNLSSRPLREEGRRHRERDRLERDLERWGSLQGAPAGCVSPAHMIPVNGRV